MNCKKVLSRISAYADGELPDKHRREMEAHFSICPACREKLEEFGQVGGMLDSLEVPALPSGFASRVTERARDRRIFSSPEEKPFSIQNWQPLRWFGELSMLMRVAAFGVIIMAFLLGSLMGREITTPVGRQITAESENMEGLEWFGSTPPASIGSAYLPLALASNERLDAR